jgi:hypothetical protein
MEEADEKNKTSWCTAKTVSLERGGGEGEVPSQVHVTSLCAMKLYMTTATFSGLKYLVHTDLLIHLRRQCYDEREKRQL